MERLRSIEEAVVVRFARSPRMNTSKAIELRRETRLTGKRNTLQRLTWQLRSSAGVVHYAQIPKTFISAVSTWIMVRGVFEA